jgi:ribosomal-protein-alanine N-acetyltransferase
VSDHKLSTTAIRKMRRGDLDDVCELSILANPHAAKQKYREHILSELEQNPDLSFAAIDGQKVVGYVQADTRNGEAMLEDIAVAREYQRKGIGKRLLDKELRALKRKGVKIVFAEVHYKCAPAIPFYYKHDFRMSGFSQDFFGIGHDAVILKLVLNKP